MTNRSLLVARFLAFAFVFSLAAVVSSATSTPWNLSYSHATFTVSSGSSVPTGYQQIITFNPSSYSSYEASNLGNLRFYQGSTELYSWCYSGCTTSSTDAVFFVKLANPVSGSGQVNMSFLPTTASYDGAYAGEAPWLSSTYAQYDNGANVFNLYYNMQSNPIAYNGTDTCSVASGPAPGNWTVTTGIGPFGTQPVLQQSSVPYGNVDSSCGPELSLAGTAPSASPFPSSFIVDAFVEFSTLNNSHIMQVGVGPGSPSLTGYLDAEESVPGAVATYASTCYLASSASADNCKTGTPMPIQPNNWFTLEYSYGGLTATPTMTGYIASGTNLSISNTPYAVSLTDTSMSSFDSIYLESYLAKPTDGIRYSLLLVRSAMPSGQAVPSVSTPVFVAGVTGTTTTATTTVASTAPTTTITPASCPYTAPYGYILDNRDSKLETLNITNVTPARSTTESVIADAADMVINPNFSRHIAYILDNRDSQMEILSTSGNTPTVISTVSVIADPAPIVMYPSGNIAYVLDNRDSQMQIINTTGVTPRTVATISVIADESGMYLSPNASYAYIIDNRDSQLEILNMSNPLSPRSVKTVSVIADPSGMVFAPGGTYAYILDNRDSQMEIVNLTNPTTPTGKIVSVIADPVQIAVNPNPSLSVAYILDNRDSQMQVISISNPAAPTTIGTISVIASPVNISFSIAGTYAYIVDNADSKMQILSTSSSSPIGVGTISVIADPSGMLVNPCGLPSPIGGSTSTSTSTTTTISGSSSTTTVTVTIPATGVYVYAPSNVIDTGQSETLQAFVNYTYLDLTPGSTQIYWQLNGKPLSVISNSLTFSGNNSDIGVDNITAFIIARSLKVQGSAFVTVNPAIKSNDITVVVPSSNLSQGQSETVSAVVSGGAVPVSYAWTFDGAALGQTGSAVTIFANSSDIGTPTISVAVTDQAGESASASNTITILSTGISTTSTTGGGGGGPVGSGGGCGLCVAGSGGGLPTVKLASTTSVPTTTIPVTTTIPSGSNTHTSTTGTGTQKSTTITGNAISAPAPPSLATILFVLIIGLLLVVLALLLLLGRKRDQDAANQQQTESESGSAHTWGAEDAEEGAATAGGASAFGDEPEGQSESSDAESASEDEGKPSRRTTKRAPAKKKRPTRRSS